MFISLDTEADTDDLPVCRSLDLLLLSTDIANTHHCLEGKRPTRQIDLIDGQSICSVQLTLYVINKNLKKKCERAIDQVFRLLCQTKKWFKNKHLACPQSNMVLWVQQLKRNAVKNELFNSIDKINQLS